jgi:hypothetical protein
MDRYKAFDEFANDYPELISLSPDLPELRYRAGDKRLNLKAANILRFATILIALIGSVSLCIAPLAFAQSDENSTRSVSESDSIPGPPPPVADDLAGPPTSATPYGLEVPETNSDVIPGDGQMLEIPQSRECGPGAKQ